MMPVTVRRAGRGGTPGVTGTRIKRRRRDIARGVLSNTRCGAPPGQVEGAAPGRHSEALAGPGSAARAGGNLKRRALRHAAHLLLLFKLVALTLLTLVPVSRAGNSGCGVCTIVNGEVVDCTSYTGGLLHLWGCGVTRIRETAFVGMTSLTNVWIQSNSLLSVPAGTFDGLPSLGEVRTFNNPWLSCNGPGLQARSLNGDPWCEHRMDACTVNVFGELQSCQNNVVVDLPASASVSSVAAGAVLGGSSTRVFDLSSQMIAHIPVERLADQIPNVNRLYLENNQLLMLTETFFSGLSSMTVLQLNNNRMMSLPDSLFNGLPLSSLQLYGNPWMSPCNGAVGLEQSVLLGNSYCAHRMDACSVDSLGVLVSCKNFAVLHVPLSVSVTTVSGQADIGGSETRIVDWSRHQIDIIGVDTWSDHVPHVEVILLNNNQLLSLPDTSFAGLSALQTLSLFDNPWLPSCPAAETNGLRQQHVLGSYFCEHRMDACTVDKQGVLRSCQDFTVLDLPSDAAVRDVANGALIGGQSTRVIDWTFQKLASLNRIFLQQHVPNVEHIVLQGNEISSVAEELFTNLPHLVRLVLDGNALTSLPGAHTFDGLPSLSTVQLAQNPWFAPCNESQGLQLLSILGQQYCSHRLDACTVSAGTLLSCPDIWVIDFPPHSVSAIAEDSLLEVKQARVVDLTNQDLAFLPSEYVFSSLTLLSHLYLSNNQLDSLPGEAVFRNVSTLTHLFLDWNRLSSLQGSDIFGGLTRLARVELQGNQIPSVPDSIFDSLVLLETLSLHDNPWLSPCPTVETNGVQQRVLAGATYCSHRMDSCVIDENGVLVSCKNYVVIDVPSRVVSRIADGATLGGAATRTVDLSNQMLASLSSGAFEQLSHATLMDVRFNPVTTLVNGTFSGMGALQLLQLPQDSLVTILPGAFRGLEALVNLDLSHQRITSLAGETFVGLDSVATVSFRGSALVHIDRSAFHGLPECTTIDLTGTDVSYFVEGTFSSLPKLTALQLSSDQWHRLDVSSCPSDTICRVRDTIVTGGLVRAEFPACAAKAGGHFCDPDAGGFSRLCPVGFWCPLLSTAAFACDRGTYNDDVGQISADACAKCSAGTYGPLTGASSSDCLFCPIGTHSPAPGAVSRADCLPCAPGTFASSIGRADCEACPIGTWSNATGAYSAESCRPCPVGSASMITRASTPDACTRCAAGRWSDHEGASTCVKCRSGTYSTGIGATSDNTCIPCAAGTYSFTSGSTNCTDCPAGHACEAASLLPVPCAKGRFAARGAASCSPCPRGYFGVGQGEASSASAGCSKCPNDAPFAEEGTDTIAACSTSARVIGAVCAAGEYAAPPDGVCIVCLAGHSCSGGSSGPVPCTEGTFAATGASSCTACAAGSYSAVPAATNCSECLNGHSCVQGSSQPIACIPGSFASAGSTSCQLCPRGYHGIGHGAASADTGCQLCPHDAPFSISGTASVAGCGDSARVIGALCDVGEYAVAPTGDCVTCTAGHFCTGGSKPSVSCPVGRYSAAGASACSLCPRGYHGVGNGTATLLEEGCALCEPDTPFSAEGTPNAAGCSDSARVNGALCAAGEHAVPPESSCVACSAGHECSGGVNAAALCPPGRFSASGASRCTPCPRGFHGIGAGGATTSEEGCTLCPDDAPFSTEGTPGPGGCSDSARVVGVLCAVGMFAVPPGGECRDCPPGHACIGGSNPALPCATGSFSNGSSTCLLCPRGYYGVGAGMARSKAEGCVLCPVDAPFSTEGAPTAAACSDSARVIGALCDVGEYAVAPTGDCVTCTAGHFCRGGTDTSLPCPVGRFSSAGAAECVPCPRGHYGIGNGAAINQSAGCALCPVDAPFAAEGTTGGAGCSDSARVNVIPCSAGEHAVPPEGRCETCPMGHACAGGFAAAASCPTGRFAKAGASSCETCPRGSFGIGDGGAAMASEACHTCPDDAPFSVEGTANAGGCSDSVRVLGVLCEVGEYAVPPEGNCDVCPPGYACVGGTAAAAPCPVGSFAGGRSAECTPCPRGYYGVGSGAASSQIEGCSACAAEAPFSAPGTSSAAGCVESARIHGIPCSAGEYALPPDGVCATCPAGHACRGGFHAAVPCARGSFAASGAAECLLCPRGFHGTGNGGAPSAVEGCELCSADTPFSTEGTPSASGCSESARVVGALCEAGRFAAPPSGDCVLCPGGFACAGGSKDKLSCPLGSFSSSGAASCTLCPAGYVGVGGVAAVDETNTTRTSLVSACRLCPENAPFSVAGSVGSSSCVSVPVGVDCAPGTFPRNAQSCDRCYVGHECAGGTSTPQACPAGTFAATTGLAVCTRCSPGKFGVEVGGTTLVTCRNCPTSTYSELPGSSSCTLCPLGTVGVGIGATSSVSGCQPCANATLCPLGATETLSLRAQHIAFQDSWSDRSAGNLSVGLDGTDPAGNVAPGVTVLPNSMMLQAPVDSGSSDISTSQLLMGGLLTSVSFLALGCHSRLPSFVRKLDRFRYEHLLEEGEPVVNRSTKLGAAFTIAFMSAATMLAWSLLVAPNTVSTTAIVAPFDVRNAAQSELHIQFLALAAGTVGSEQPCSIDNVNVQVDGLGSQRRVTVVAEEDWCAIHLECKACVFTGVSSVTVRLPWNYQAIAWAANTTSTLLLSAVSGLIRPENTTLLSFTQPSHVDLTLLPSLLFGVDGTLTASGYALSLKSQDVASAGGSQAATVTLDDQVEIVMSMAVTDIVHRTIHSQKLTWQQRFGSLLSAIVSLLPPVAFWFRWSEASLQRIVRRSRAPGQPLDERSKHSAHSPILGGVPQNVEVRQRRATFTSTDASAVHQSHPPRRAPPRRTTTSMSRASALRPHRATAIIELRGKLPVGRTPADRVVNRPRAPTADATSPETQLRAVPSVTAAVSAIEGRQLTASVGPGKGSRKASWAVSNPMHDPALEGAPRVERQ